MSFFSALLEETGARRKRLRKALGDRGQSLFELALIAGLLVGALGFYLRDWAAPLGPFGLLPLAAFVIGYPIIDARRQAELNGGAAEEAVRKRYDLAAMAWAILCAGAGLAILVYVLLAPPPASPADTGWQPPAGAVNVDMGQ